MSFYINDFVNERSERYAGWNRMKNIKWTDWEWQNDDAWTWKSGLFNCAYKSSKGRETGRAGMIKGYTEKVNNVKLVYYVHTLITVLMDAADHRQYLAFVGNACKYVIDNYKISGDGCYMLESRFPSHDVTDEFLKGLSGHANYKLSIDINK